MKIALAALLVLPLVSLAAFAAAQDDANPPRDDHAAVERAMKDYVHGFYDARPDLIERGVSKDLEKMGYWRMDEDQPYSDAKHMTFEEAKALAASWNKGGKQGENLTYELEIFDVLDKTACGKLTAHWGVDFFQLVKEKDGAWKIHHVLWQSHPPKSDAKK